MSKRFLTALMVLLFQRASSLKSVKNIQILSISNTISSRSSHVNADTAIYIVNYDDGFALLGADYRLDPIYAISTEGNFHTV